MGAHPLPTLKNLGPKKTFDNEFERIRRQHHSDGRIQKCARETAQMWTKGMMSKKRVRQQEATFQMRKMEMATNDRLEMPPPIVSTTWYDPRGQHRGTDCLGRIPNDPASWPPLLLLPKLRP